MTGKPARQLRTEWTEAWERPTTPPTAADAAAGHPVLRGGAAGSPGRRTGPLGLPVGQIVGRMNSVRPAQDVVFDIVEEWIETTQRLDTLIETE